MHVAPVSSKPKPIALSGSARGRNCRFIAQKLKSLFQLCVFRSWPGRRRRGFDVGLIRFRFLVVASQVRDIRGVSFRPFNFYRRRYP